MAEMERTRERERGTIAESPYEMLIRSRREFLERQEKGQVVIKPADREFYLTRQGRLMYHLNPEIHKDTPLQDWRVFSHDLKTQSGKHRHQGGLVIYVITGKGYSVVDGERIDWDAGTSCCCRSNRAASSTSISICSPDRTAAGSRSPICRSSTMWHRSSRRPRSRHCSKHSRNY